MMNVMLQAGAVAPAAAQGGSMWSSILMIVMLFVVMYFFMIRPQQKRQKELMKFRQSLEKGNKVITAGGIYGTIKSVEENTVMLEVDHNVAIRVDKSSLMRDPSDIVR